jgi:glycosyltransferase involved in cell wall biosynthesis
LRWIVTQIGSREHYSVPRAFHLRGHLDHFYTDVWLRRSADWLKKRSGKVAALANRFHPGLPPEKVTAFNFATFRRLLNERLHGREQSMAERYNQFDAIGREFAENVNLDLDRRGFAPAGAAGFLFSTGALETAQYLRKHKVPVVVDQLDPARLDETMVRAEMEKWPGWQELPGEVPESYYQRLAEEWRLADVILVNSNWSKKNLLQEGMDARKIIVVPLCYEPELGPTASKAVEIESKQTSPVSTSSGLSSIRDKDYPLTVLWIGQIILRKGIQYLFESARELQSTNIRFIVAGRIGISQLGLDAAPKNVSILGTIPRAQVIDLFRRADVFVLPTVSEGFALTQLEAMSFGLPIITTPNCGEVVTPGIDGIIIPAGDSHSLTEAILSLDRDRELLRTMSDKARAKPLERRFTLEGYADAVETAVRSLCSR